MSFETEFKLSIGLKITGAIIILVTFGIFAATVFQAVAVGGWANYFLTCTTGYIFFASLSSIVTGGRWERNLWKWLRRKS